MVRDLLMKVELNKMNTSQGMKVGRVGCGGEALYMKALEFLSNLEFCIGLRVVIGRGVSRTKGNFVKII